ncbi:GNAT family N-acetyltransferase [bacterium BFN5]|nr:GNAT family N-acetyltransferase [bacterium BFN5]QJW45135.1 GNAT family N-acetyltransferase [bacterium BFN5]
MEIELIKNADLEVQNRLVYLENQAFGSGGLNEWHLIPLIRHGRVFAARKDQTIIGVIEYMLDWDNPRKAYMIGVSIAKEARGQGLGTELIKRTLQFLSRENLTDVELTVHPENLAAIRVYENKLGFKTEELRTDEYGQGEDRLVMTLSLENYRTY